MNQPNFVCDSLNYSIAHPSNWEVGNDVGESNGISIGGVSLKDVSYRKHSYTLDWDSISIADYDKLMEIYNKHLDDSEDITFTYGKWSVASAGVVCKMLVSGRGFVAGDGDTLYYSKVSIVLTEVNPR